MTAYERRALTRGEEAQALGVAAGVALAAAAVALYLARLLLQRERG